MPEAYKSVKKPKKKNGKKEASVNYLKQTSAYQQRKQPMGRNMLSDLQPLFRVMQGLELEAPRQVVILGIVIDTIQIIGFAFNPHMNGSTVSHGIAKAVYAFQIPIWDSAISSADYLSNMIVSWVYTAVIALLFIETLYRVRQSTEYSTSPFHAKVSVSIFGSFMFIPVLQQALSMIVCDSSGKLAAFGSEDCREGVGIIRLVGAVIGGILIVLIAVLSNLFLYNVNPQSRHRLARFHCRCDILNITFKVTSCILFQWSLASDNLDVFYAFLACGSFVLSWSWIVFLPYYSQEVVFYRVATLWLTAFFACTNLIVSDDVSASNDLPLLGIGSIIVIAAAHRAHRLRVSSAFRRSIHLMLYKNEFSNVTYPKGLPGTPNQLDEWSVFLELGGMEDSIKSERVTGSLVTPYVSSITFATDCELACRYARAYVNMTGYAPSTAMIKLGCEIYIRGLHRFKNNPDILLGFVLFLCHYRKGEQACKEVSSHLTETDCSLFIRYQAFKLDQTVKVDSTHLERYESAKSLHKGCLQNKIDFWKILIPEDYDKLMLDTKARSLAEQSEQALNEYLYALRLGDSKRNLHTSDIRMILHYGQFFEQVLSAKDIANRCFAVSSEHLKLRESKQLRGAKRKAANEIGIGHLPTAEEARSVEEQDHTNNMQSSGRDTIIHAARMLNAVFVCLVILLFGFLGITIITTENRKEILQSVAAIAKVRSYSEQATLLVELMEDTPQQDLSWHQNMHSKLADVVEALHTNLNMCMWGSKSPTFSKLEPIIHQPHYKIINRIGTDTFQTLESTWTLGYRTTEMLYSYMMKPLGQNLTGSLFIAEPDLVGEVINRTSSLFTDWDKAVVDTSIQVLVISFGASALLVTVVFIMLTLKFNAVEKSKKSIRNFVTLIPKDIVKDHHAQAVQSLKHFEKYLRRPELLLSLDINQAQFGAPQVEQESAVQMGAAAETQSERSSLTHISKATKDDKSSHTAQALVLNDKRSKDIGSEFSRSPQDKGPLYASGYVKCLLYGITILLIAELPLILATRVQYNNAAAELDTHKAIRNMEAIVRNIGDLYVTAIDFLDHPEHEYERFSQLYMKNALAPEILSYVSRYPDGGFSSAAADTVTLADHYISGMKLAMIGHNVTITETNLMDKTWVSPKSPFISIPDYIPLDAPVRELTTNVIDELYHDPLRLSRSHMSWDYTVEKTILLSDNWKGKISSISKKSTEAVNSLTEDAEMSQRIEVILSCFILIAMFLISLEHKRAPLINSRIRTTCLLLAFALAATNLGMGIAGLKQVPEIRDHSKKVFVINDIPHNVTTVGVLSSACSQFGDMKYYRALEDLLFDILHQQHPSDISDYDEEHLFIPPASEKLVKIGMVLVGVAFHLEDHMNPEMTYYDWDQTKDQDLLFYSGILHNRSYDTSLPIEELRALSRYVSYLGNVAMIKTTMEAVTYHYGLDDDELRQTHDLLDKQLEFRLDQIVVVSGALFCLGVFYFSMFIAAVAIKEVNEKYDANQLGMSLGTQIEKMSYALGLVFMLITGIFVFSIVRMDVAEGAVSRIATSASREWLLSASMLSINRIAHNINTIELHSLETTLSDIKSAHHRLYFHHKDTSTYNGVGLDSKQDELLFGHHVTIPIQYKPNTGCTIRDSHIQEILTHGLHSAVEKWITYSAAVLSLARGESSDREHMILAVTADMRVQYESLIDALYYSTSLYLTDAIATEDETASSMTIAVCCAIFLMLLDFFMIFKPIMKGLFQDEKITGLILRLIPSHLIDQQDFTTNGNDDRGSKVSDMVTEMSPIPLIAIDHNGIIAKFSQNAVRECFQYQAVELTGTNLKILMPEEFASKHDQYLAHYRRTRIKKIIDRARIVRGRRKDGEEFPAEVMVRQFKCLGEDMYIGFIRDLTSDVALKSSARQNKLIQEMNRSCVINVDPMGTILSVNRAMTVDFGYQPEELLGENIKMIMPSSVAVMHDTYLENYRNSGKKTILGVTLSSTAQKKNGDLFSIQLKADAIDCDPPEYIGFIRNTVNEARLRAQNDVNSGIVENFPTSCVLIDQLGTILKFGRAAERDFGYSAKNAVGQNIKILMPLSIANQHDQFLSTYAKTRVKRVIGSSRNTEGKHRDGGVFQIKITVAEVENKTLGSNAYIGFVEDMTQWNLIKMNQDVNRVVFEQSCEPIIVISNEGIILQINKNALNAFGYLKDEVLNQNIKMLMPPHVGDIHDGYLAAYLRTGVKTVIDNIMRVVGKRKDNCDLHLSLRVIEIEVAEKTCYCGFARDLTEEIAGQVTFKNNEAIMQISAEGVVVIDRFGIIIRFNHQAQKIWGYSEIEMVGANVSELCPPTHAEKHDGYLVAYAKTGIKHVIDAKVKVDAVKKGGMEFQTNLRVKELKTDHGNYFVGFTADAMMEAKVHVQSETYSELRKAIPVCWLTIDTYGTIKNFGSKAIEQFQFSEEEALGNNVSMLMPPDIAAKHDGFLKRYRVSGFNRIGPEGTKVTAKRKDGAPVDIHLNMDGFSIPTATGSMDEFVVAFAVDITELLQYQQVIANINKIVDVSFNGIIVIDSFGTILKFSKAASKMFGYTEKEVISKNIKVLMGEPHKSQHDGYLNAYKRTGVGKIVGTQTMVEGRSKTGDVVPVILSLVQISLNGDSIFMGNIVDASVQRRAHLFHKKNLVATEMSTSSIIVTDTIGTILRANQATFDLFGYTSEEIVGSNVKMLTPPEIAENHDGYLKKYLQTGEATVMGKTTVLKAIDKWGTQFSIELRLNEIHKLDDNNYIAFIDDRRAEEQAETHRLVQNLEVHLSVDPLIGMDADGTVNLFTKSAELLSGFTADEVIGQNIKMLMPEEIAIKHDGYLDAFRRTRIKTVVDTDAQVYVKHKDGHVITVASVIREIIKENGSYSFVGFLCDNSEYEDAKHKEALGECILENNPVAMISIDDVGTIQQFNLAAEQEFGYNASVAVGKNIKIIIPDEVAVKHDGYLKRYRETKIARIIGSPQKLTAMTSGRERIPISLTIVPVRTGKGDEERYVSFIESLAVNMLFEYTESLVAAMIHLCPVPLVVADQQGIIERFSGSAEELFEQDSDILGKNVSLLLPEEIAVKHDGYLKRYKMTGVARVIGKVTRGYNGLTKSGKEFPCQLAVKEIKKEGRESTYVACVLDITEIAKVEHQVELGKAITKSSTMPLISISSTGMARCYSRSAEELFGFTEEEIVGNNIKIMMPEETAINHDGYLERYKKTRIKKVIDTTRQVKAKHKSGYGIDVILKVKELCVQGTTIYVSYITDLTVQLNLAWESKLHHTLVSGVKDPVIVMGTDSKIISLNKATAEVFQFEPDQLINRHVRLLMPDETSARHDNYVSVHLRSRKPEPLNAKRYITAERKDGSPVRAFIHIIEVRLSGGEIRFLSKMQIQK